MRGLEIWFHDLIASDEPSFFDTNGAGGAGAGGGGGLFLEHSVVSFPWDRRRDHRVYSSGRFLSVTLSSTNTNSNQGEFGRERYKNITDNNNNINSNSEEDETMSFEVVEEYKMLNKKKKDKVKLSGGASAFNTTKHLWAGAVSAMVSRYICSLIFSYVSYIRLFDDLLWFVICFCN